MNDVKKFVIDRTKWLRGEGGNQSSLLRASDGKMCCLGFYCLALGFCNRDIMGVGTPSVFIARFHNDSDFCIPPWLGSKNVTTDDCLLLMEANDNLANGNLTEESREAEIKQVFARNGVEVEFTG